MMMRREITLLLACTVLAGCGGAQPPLATPSAAHVAPKAQAVTHFAKTAERVLYSFTGGTDGGDPAADLVLGPSGKLYGTTVVGGADSCGTVFSLTPHATPPWKESVHYNFSCYSDGKNPYGGVTFGPSGVSREDGDLFGTTVSGGSGGSCGSTGCGVAFELSRSHESVLHSFTGGNDGFGPGAGLGVAKDGDLYGTTPDGGSDSDGVVYRLYNNRNGWHETVIHAFSGSDGAVPSLGRILVDTRSIYGVTELGGTYGAGTVFRLTTIKNGWRFTTLYAFKSAPDCASPYGGLATDSQGNLYGTTYYGGSSGMGCLFMLVAHHNHTYTETILHSFEGGSDGSSPTSTPTYISNSHGTNIFGTTSTGGGTCDCGTIFSLNTKTNKETVRHAFSGGGDGAYPYYGLAEDTAGNLYGTTAAGGASNQGTVFEFVR